MMHRRDAAMPADLFSIRRLSLCLLPLLVLAMWVLALSGFASAGGRATAEQPAQLSISVPSAAKRANVVMLELSISVVRKPRTGQLGAAIRLDGSEVGRVSIVDGAQSYQFNVAQALRQASGGSATVEVELIDRGGGAAPSGAELSISRAQIITR
jgi:hypothetical protein